jgi:hypothetical protein
VSNNNSDQPVPLTKEERRTLLHRYATPKIDAACEKEKSTKELILHFNKFTVAEEDDSSAEDNIPLSHLATQTNVIGNPLLKKNQNQSRGQPGQPGAPTTKLSKRQQVSQYKQRNAKGKAANRKAHGRA